MPKEYLRTYQEFDVEEVQKHLLIVGDLSADCASCRELGLDPWTVTECPQCKTSFRFATSRRLESNPGERFKIVKRFLQKRPEFTFIDYTDYDKTMGKKKARDFFG